MRTEAEAENHRLRQEILTAADEYSRKIETLQALHEQKLEKLKMEMDKILTVKHLSVSSKLQCIEEPFSNLFHIR